MALPASGTITLADIRDEFGPPYNAGSNSINSVGLNEYYRGGLYVTSNNTSVPTDGEISLSNFYGAAKEFWVTISSNVQNANLYDIVLNAGWDQILRVRVFIPSGVYIWSDSTSTSGMLIPSNFSAGIAIVNSGFIMGIGGAGGQYGGAG